MKTPTHFIINFVLADRLGWPRPIRWAFALGGVLPDIPITLVFAYLVSAELVFGSGDSAYAIDIFQNLYATKPWLISAHNLLHAPLTISLLLLLTLLSFNRVINTLRFVLLGSALHSFIDIDTHVNDGPLMLWPFEWHSRFISPISHWDANHFGHITIFLEAMIMIAFTLYLANKYRIRYLTSAVDK